MLKGLRPIADWAGLLNTNFQINYLCAQHVLSHLGIGSFCLQINEPLCGQEARRFHHFCNKKQLVFKSETILDLKWHSIFDTVTSLCFLFDNSAGIYIKYSLLFRQRSNWPNIVYDWIGLNHNHTIDKLFTFLFITFFFNILFHTCSLVTVLSECSAT